MKNGGVEEENKITEREEEKKGGAERKGREREEEKKGRGEDWKRRMGKKDKRHVGVKEWRSRREK